MTTELSYNGNSKQLSIEIDKKYELTDARSINVNQINKLTTAIIGESNPNFTPKPNDNLSKMIRNMFETGIKNMKQNKMQEALKNLTLAIEMSQRKRAPYEAFQIQLQDVQFMLRQKIDLELILGKNLEALQDLEMLLNTGLLDPEIFLRKTDAYLKLKQYNLARVDCERGLSLFPTNPKLKVMLNECNRRLAEYNGDI
ncbi:hypothetical protein Kpol_543p27 [Vanderwaltozyma polyspora DSM 70294]|uniref:Uncharacterized protein n=1 Tax=Vanderwaltozyma polyspora (strain ATCC 22028 / DSM 70294 / BCRC 21397 / CBS 2163 / NBRC 10782 / NRRL Y-8283 / UCD 57-17) TaxID=436907 RepID=A7THN1_VANPO|nr:uncharacterized protein Kpol_543p27 [Vanderwaltozyma polyspora DSM 70294]EDO18197.1 hypothetical protein Kpol_543p27 [Vanderwaltozyma polyspora DSM 70294]